MSYHIIVQRFEQLVDTALYKCLLLLLLLLLFSGKVGDETVRHHWSLRHFGVVLDQSIN